MKDMRKVNEHREYVNDIADDCAREHSFDGLDVRAYNSCKYGFLEGYGRAEKDLGWVNVKDRLPETPAYVFVCIDDNGIPQSVGFAFYADGKWWEGYDEPEEGPVDYWMPIPQFKEDEK